MLNLTQQERRVILFLIMVSLSGLGINLVSKRYSRDSRVKVIAQINQDIGRINLNLADKEMLLGVPGIGEKLSQRIIEYRQQKEGFKDISELKEIRGIGNSKYEAIKDYLGLE